VTAAASVRRHRVRSRRLGCGWSRTDRRAPRTGDL